MRIHHGTSTVKTSGPVSIENVTGRVREIVSQAGVRDGIVLVTVPHTTCGLAVNEDEPGLKDDLRRLAASLLDPLEAGGGFRHDCVDDNARAHLTAVLLGNSISLPVSGGELSLGTWQSVFLVEMDGPRSRRLSVQVLGQ